MATAKKVGVSKVATKKPAAVKATAKKSIVKKVSAKKATTLKLKLTEEQLTQIKDAFGAKFAKRVQSLSVDQIEGYLRSNVVVN